MNYLDYVNEKCIECNRCMKSCDFLTKYHINLKDYTKREDLKYSCFLCDSCKMVCPVDLSGKEVSTNLRKGEDKGFSLLKFEKSPYIFRNNSKKKSEILLFLGCSFPRVYPKTSKKLIDLLEKHNIDFSIDCCGKPIYETGDTQKIESHRQRLSKIFAQKNTKTIVTACMNCYYFFKDEYDIEVISIYKLLRDLGIGKRSKDCINVFIPCPDKKSESVLDEIKYFYSNLKTPFKDIQCCGLGGLAISKEADIANGFIEKLSDKKMPVTTYCASCSLRFKKNNMDLNGHLLTKILGTNEEENTGYFKGNMSIRNYRRTR